MVAGVTLVLSIMLAGGTMETVEVNTTSTETRLELEATAYYNKYNNACADGTMPKANHTLAGKREWLGRECYLYDGSGDLLGEYTFSDIGYGKPLGWGESSLLKGKTIGDIEGGYTVDIFFNTYKECVNWGRQTVYLEWKEVR